MTPEEYLERYAMIKNGPMTFDQRFRGGPAVSDRTGESLREGGLGALKAEILKNSGAFLDITGRNTPKIGPPSTLGVQAGASQLDRAITDPFLQAELFTNVLPPDDPAAIIVDDYIGNSGGEI